MFTIVNFDISYLYLIIICSKTTKKTFSAFSRRNGGGDICLIDSTLFYLGIIYVDVKHCRNTGFVYSTMIELADISSYLLSLDIEQGGNDVDYE